MSTVEHSAFRQRFASYRWRDCLIVIGFVTIAITAQWFLRPVFGKSFAWLLGVLGSAGGFGILRILKRSRDWANWFGLIVVAVLVIAGANWHRVHHGRFWGTMYREIVDDKVREHFPALRQFIQQRRSGPFEISVEQRKLTFILVRGVSESREEVELLAKEAEQLRLPYTIWWNFETPNGTTYGVETPAYRDDLQRLGGAS